MGMFLLPDDCHAALRKLATAQGVSMTSILRAALEHFAADPCEVQNAADIRAKTWHVRAYLWRDDWLLRETAATIASTGELPALAAAFVGDPGAAALVRADLPRLRQVLARVHSTSARIAGPDGLMLQIDVHRAAPQGSDGDYTPPDNIRTR